MSEIHNPPEVEEKTVLPPVDEFERRKREAMAPPELPKVAGPNYRNLSIAAGGLLVLLGLMVFFTPKRTPRPEPKVAPSLPEKTFLDEPIGEGKDVNPREPWWKRFAGQGQGASEAGELGEEDTGRFHAWPEEGPPEPAAYAPAPPPDPRREALERALKSSKTQRPSVPAPPPGRTPASAAMEPLLASAAQLLPTPDQVKEMLAAAQAAGGSAVPSLGSALPSAGAASTLAAQHGASAATPYPALRSSLSSASTLRAGTLIPARLETALNSDAPGPVTARVLRDVTDSATGQRVLIPAGAVLLGSVANQVTLGRDRALVAFERVSWPGTSYELPGFDGLELTGTRGLTGAVNHHTFSLLGRAALLAAVGAGFELAEPDRGSSGDLRPGELVSARMALELDRVASRILERGLDRPPTVKVPAGERFYVYLPQDLELKADLEL